MLKKLLQITLNVFGSHASQEAPPYTLFSPISSDKLGCWAAHYPDFNEIIGYSNLGHIFLKSQPGEYIVLHPFKKAAKSYGTFSSITDFEKGILKEPGFSEHILRPKHVSLITNRLGPLNKDEIYIPQPYPFLGGTETPTTYDKGNVWVFMDIVAQMHGLCG